MTPSVAMRWLRFNAAGLFGIGVQLAVLSFLTRMGADYFAATLVAVECAILHNFLWHERWTWSERASRAAGDWPRRLLRFHLANGAISIAGNALLMWWLVGLLGGPVLLSNLLSIALCGTANFIAGDLFVFRRAQESAPPGGSAS